jgi:hypothetical protein
MKNSEIIKYINHYCANNNDLDAVSNADLVFTILAHGYLYVRPGKPTTEFTLKIIEAFKAGAIDGFNKHLEPLGGEWPLDDEIRFAMASAALEVARNTFDKKYFEEQIAFFDPDEECDSSLLDKYLNLMNKEQLCDFFYNVCRYSVCYSVFSGGDIAFEIEDELHKCCREMDPALPKEHYDSKRNVSYRKEHPYYMADYLSHDEIADAIKRVVVDSKTLAGHVARQFYYTNDFDSLHLYILLLSAYERVFRKELYNPEIRIWEYSDDSDEA